MSHREEKRTIVELERNTMYKCQCGCGKLGTHLGKEGDDIVVFGCESKVVGWLNERRL